MIQDNIFESLPVKLTVKNVDFFHFCMSTRPHLKNSIVVDGNEINWSSSFKKAVFTCVPCGLCCKIYRIVIEEADIEKMGLNSNQWINNNGELNLTRNNENCCIFNNKPLCKKYEVRPRNCRIYPFDIIIINENKVILDLVYTCPFVGEGEEKTAQEINKLLEHHIINGKKAFFAKALENVKKQKSILSSTNSNDLYFEQCVSQTADWIEKHFLHDNPVFSFYSGILKECNLSSGKKLISLRDLVHSCWFVFQNNLSSIIKEDKEIKELFIYTKEDSIVLNDKICHIEESSPLPLSREAKEELKLYLIENAHRGKHIDFLLNVISKNPEDFPPLLVSLLSLYFILGVTYTIALCRAISQKKSVIDKSNIREGISYAESALYFIHMANWEEILTKIEY